MTTHADRAHAILSASGASRWMACPGSALAEDASPPGADSRASVEGTAQHEAVEWLYAHPGETVEGRLFNGVVITPEMAEAVEEVVDLYRELSTQYGVPPQLEIKITNTGIHPDCWGTVDCAFVVPFETVHIVDAKFGRRPVAASTPQMLVYGAQLAIENEAKRLFCEIAQPYTQEGRKFCSYTLDECRAFLARARSLARKAMQPDAPRIAGDHCLWCRAKGACKSFEAHMHQLAVADFSGPEQVPTLRVPSEMSPEQLGAALDFADAIEQWLNGLRGAALDAAQRGCPPVGYKLVQGRKGARKWQAADDTVAAVLSREGLDPYTHKLITPAQAEKALGKKKAAELLSPMTVQSEGKPSLAPEGDRRPAISGPGADFQ